MDKVETINITVKIPSNDVVKLRNFLDEHIEVVDFKIMPDTDRMHKEDKHFQKLSASKKQINKKIGEYINDNNQKYLKTETNV